MTRRAALPARVLEFCRTRGLLAPGNRVLAAVSGGPDSIVLMHLLHGLRGALKIDLSVAHVDHGLRAGSARDTAFVARQAAALGLECRVRRVTVPRAGRSLEAAARDARYEALREMASEAEADRIATGHTATDQAETVLLRLLRGTGPLGLAAIGDGTAGGVVRPLLCATADDVRALAADRGLACRQDPSNRDRRIVRNRVRAEVLPLLRALNPRIDFALCALADDAAGLSRALQQAVAVPAVDGEARIPRPDGPDPLLPYRVRSAFEAVTGAPLGLSRTHLDAVVDLLARPDGHGEAHLPRRVVATVDRHGLRMRVDPEGPPPGSRRRGRGGAA